MIYFIECGEFIKIGHTSNVKNRIKSFQSASPYTVNLLFAVRGGFVAEQKLHKRFEQFHHRGEWFRKCPELLADIEVARQELELLPPESNLQISKHEFAMDLARVFKLTTKEMEILGLLSGNGQANNG